MCKMLDAKGVMELLGVSESKAYSLIRQMNAELEAKGFIVLRGKIPQSYAERRFFGFSDDQGRAEA